MQGATLDEHRFPKPGRGVVVDLEVAVLAPHPGRDGDRALAVGALDEGRQAGQLHGRHPDPVGQGQLLLRRILDDVSAEVEIEAGHGEQIPAMVIEERPVFDGRHLRLVDQRAERGDGRILAVVAILRHEPGVLLAAIEMRHEFATHDRHLVIVVGDADRLDVIERTLPSQGPARDDGVHPTGVPVAVHFRVVALPLQPEAAPFDIDALPAGRAEIVAELEEKIVSLGVPD